MSGGHRETRPAPILVLFGEGSALAIVRTLSEDERTLGLTSPLPAPELYTSVAVMMNARCPHTGSPVQLTGTVCPAPDDAVIDYAVRLHPPERDDAMAAVVAYLRDDLRLRQVAA